MNKQVIAKETYRLGDQWDLTDKREGVYKIYDDGSVELTCKECAEVYELPADNKFAEIVVGNNEAAKHSTCSNCWKLGEGKKEKRTYNPEAPRIGQAVNKAIDIALSRGDFAGDKFEWPAEKLEEYYEAVLLWSDEKQNG